MAPADDRLVVAVDAVVAQPDDLDVAEGVGLVEVDQALLEQLEHGEEAHDDLEPLDERRRSGRGR